MPVTRVHVVRHVPFEGPASIASWAKQRDLPLTDAMVDELPDAESDDLLVSMGGPMSVNDDLPWVKAEQAFIRRHVDAGGAFIGVCLGAQQLAGAFGAATRPRAPEHGWLPVDATAAGQAFELPRSFTAFHWHGEMSDLPAEATLLASTEACPHQVFAIGDRAIGLQCHLEADAATVAALIKHCCEDLATNPADPKPAELIEQTTVHLPAARQLLHRLLDRIAR